MFVAAGGAKWAADLPPSWRGLLKCGFYTYGLTGRKIHWFQTAFYKIYKFCVCLVASFQSTQTKLKLENWKIFLPWGAGVNSELFAAECSKSPDPSPGASPRATSFSRGVSMLRGTLKKNMIENLRRTNFKTEAWLWKRIKCFCTPYAREIWKRNNLWQELVILVILNLCLRKNFLNRREITQITFSKSFVFKMFSIHAKMQSWRFQIPPELKSVFEKHRFHDGLVWMVDLTEEKML